MSWGPLSFIWKCPRDMLSWIKTFAVSNITNECSIQSATEKIVIAVPKACPWRIIFVVMRYIFWIVLKLDSKFNKPVMRVEEICVHSSTKFKWRIEDWIETQFSSTQLNLILLNDEKWEKSRHNSTTFSCFLQLVFLLQWSSLGW